MDRTLLGCLLFPPCRTNDVNGVIFDYLDPPTLAAGLATARKFVDTSDASVKWSRLLRAWVPRVYNEDGWFERLRLVRMHAIVRVLLLQNLCPIIRDEGVRCAKWSQTEYAFTPREKTVAERNIALYCAGSYPLHKWMERTGQRQQWEPGDVDFFFVYTRTPPSNGEWNDAESIYEEQVQSWIEDFRRYVLKNSTSSCKRNIRELSRHRLSIPPGHDDRFGVRRENNETLAYGQDDYRTNMIYKIKDFEILFGAERLAIFSFIFWRDYTTDTPSLAQVYDSFDINICQVGISPAITTLNPDDNTVVAMDGTTLVIAPRSEDIGTGITQKVGRIVKKDPRGRSRRQKYLQRGFEIHLR